MTSGTLSGSLDILPETFEKQLKLAEVPETLFLTFKCFPLLNQRTCMGNSYSLTIYEFVTAYL